MLEIEYLIAPLDDVVGHALLAQVLLAVLQIVAKRLFGQRGLTVAVGIELVEHEDTSLLKIEYLARLGPLRFTNGAGVESADGSNPEISIFVNFALAIEELHHTPETA